MHVGWWCRWADELYLAVVGCTLLNWIVLGCMWCCSWEDGLYLTLLCCSGLYFAELDCTRMHVVVQMGGRTAFQANLTHHL